MSNPTPESQTRNTTTTTQPAATAERAPLPDKTRRIEALRTQFDAQRSLGFKGHLI